MSGAGHGAILLPAACGRRQQQQWQRQPRWTAQAQQQINSNNKKLRIASGRENQKSQKCSTNNAQCEILMQKLLCVCAWCLCVLCVCVCVWVDVCCPTVNQAANQQTSTTTMQRKATQRQKQKLLLSVRSSNNCSSRPATTTVATTRAATTTAATSHIHWRHKVFTCRRVNSLIASAAPCVFWLLPFADDPPCCKGYLLPMYVCVWVCMRECHSQSIAGWRRPTRAVGSQRSVQRARSANSLAIFPLLLSHKTIRTPLATSVNECEYCWQCECTHSVCP